MGRNKNPSPKVRLNIDMTVATRAKVEAVQKVTAAASLAEVVRKAVWVYDYLVTEKKAGATLVIRYGQVERELIFPELEA